MKILSVRFTNLNSLAGTTRIDFTDPGFSSGVFLITGPTGSGKTTILDAITLALFGRTGRQKSFSRRTSENAGTNEAMNRDAGFCSAEVEFVGADGKRYRAAWSQARAWRKASGALQGVRRTLVAVGDDGERDVSEHTTTDTGALVEAKLGFSFEEFTRSVILEQGQFDSFLRAEPDDLGNILEKATRTWRFSETGRAIFAAFQRAQKTLDEAKGAVEHYDKGVLSPEALAELSARAEALRAESARLAGEQGRLEAIIRWQEEERRLGGQGEALRAERSAFDAGEEEARRRATSLEQAKKARGADVCGSELAAATRALAEAREQLLRQEREIGRRSQELPRLQEEEREAARAAVGARAEKAGKDALVARARELDGRLRQARDAIASTSRALADSRARLGKARGALASAKDKAASLDRLAAFIHEYQAGPAPVPGEFSRAPVVRAIDAFREAGASLAAGEAGLQALEEAATEAEGLFAAADREWPALREALDGCVERAGQVVRQAHVVASLADHRAALVEGEPCPLCGATAHPYARPGGQVEAFDEAERKLAEAKAKREEGQARHDGSRDAAQAARARYDRALLACQASRTALSSARGAVERELEAVRVRRAALADELGHLGAGLAEAAADERLRAAEAADAAEPLAALEAERKAIPFDDPDAEARRLQRLLAVRETAATRAEELRRASEAWLAEARRSHGESQAEAARKEEAAREARDRFDAKLSAAGFTDEPSWRSARLEEDAFIGLERAVAARQEASSALVAREADHGKAVSIHAGGRPCDAIPPEEEAGTRLAAVRKTLEEIASGLGGIGAQLARNDADEKNRRKARETLAAAAAAFEKWKNLNKWLGGEAGRNFRVYAQGRTLARLLEAAKPHLCKMSGGRYSLAWDPGSGTLKPQIVDHFLGDEVREVTNLSGGETFMVSLALTLGLSRLSGDHFSVGSLFLDEGFGTLDESCLQLALDTLSKLHSEGCLVGIISHVEAVKEFIPSRIEVKRTGPGAGVVTGPGVTAGPAEA